MRNFLKPRLLVGDWTFQQNNAPAHVSNSSKNRLRIKNIKIMDWPYTAMSKMLGIATPIAAHIYMDTDHRYGFS